MHVGIANVNWYVVVKGNDSLYMQKYSIISGFEDTFHAFPINESYLNEIDNDIAEKMRWFAKGFYSSEKEKEKIRIYNLQVDMRRIVTLETKKSPTIGYYEVPHNN